MSSLWRYYLHMIVSKGIDFTSAPPLFSKLQNKGQDYLVSVSRRLMRSLRFPFALLLTCDRAEVVAEGEFGHEVLERSLGLNPAAVRNYRYTVEGDAAVRRMFLLASGILSPLFGEDTIQGQINDSLEAGRTAGTLSPRLAKLLNMAVSFSKRVHSGMRLRVFDGTIVDKVEELTAGYGQILVIGSGEGARMTAERLLRSHRVLITLRDIDKTFLIPPGAVAVSYDERRKYIEQSDVIITATSGLYHTLDASDGTLIGGRLLIDLSSPPDTPPELHALRVEDMAIDLPERNNVTRAVEDAADEAVREYERWCMNSDASSQISLKAESIAYETLRRMSDVITRSGIEDEKAFRLSLFESVRKAVVSAEMNARKS